MNETVALILGALEESSAIIESGRPSTSPSLQPTVIGAEELHEEDAYAAVFLNIVLIICVLVSYLIKEYKVYFLPESAAAMIIGVAIGAFLSFFVTDLTLYQFSPEFFFFVLLPPIIFEAGYALEKKRFFENIGAITLYAVFGTIISTFTVGMLTFLCAKHGLIDGVSTTNPMESLLFGALISAVDPVATLSIMNNPELQCNKLLYSLVFGESVLNDAVAIVLFKTFREYYDPDAPNLSSGDIPRVFVAFFTISALSILVGATSGLITSFIYKNTQIQKYANLESTLLFLFCYFCFAVAESLGLSGIMALFFNGIVLSHYNAYNLSEGSRHATEQIFATVATLSETIVFLYMGMGVFTGKFSNWNLSFTLFAMLFCVIGRFINIFPLSFISNYRRGKKSKINCKMQTVLWFAGLRGAIAYALAENMPGENKATYVAGTLSICLITTVLCGGFTERILYVTGMKEDPKSIEFEEDRIDDGEDEALVTDSFEDDASTIFPSQSKDMERVYKGLKNSAVQFDRKYMQVNFGGINRDNVEDEFEAGDFELEEINSDK